MITFDRIMIKSPMRDNLKGYIINIPDYDGYEVIERDGKIQKYIYNAKDKKNPKPLPYNLFIKMDFIREEMVMNVSSKILRDDYHQLISIQTLPSVILNIQEMGLLEINNYDWWFNNSQMIGCDVTFDYGLQFKKINYETLKNLRTKPLDWQVLTYTDETILFNKSTKCKKTKYSIKFYDKEREIIQTKNVKFLQCCSEPNILTNRFKGRTRCELQLRSAYGIRRVFNKKYHLTDVMNSTADPLSFVTNEIFTTKSETWQGILSLKNFTDFCVLKAHEFCLVTALDEFKKYKCRTTKLKPVRDRYASILADRNNLNDSTSINFIEDLQSGVFHQAAPEKPE